MKRLVSILLFSLLLYNMVGYSIVYWLGGNVALHKQEIQSDSTLNEEYITVKVPVALPYQTNWTAPQPVQGSIQVGEEFFEMVEQIMLNDTLYITCKSDHHARKNFFALAQHIDNHIKDYNGSTHDSSKNKTLSILKEYVSFGRLHVFFWVEWLPDTTPSISITYTLLLRALPLFSPPPEEVDF
ncbi:hypothetical protein P1X15_12335 [Runella sp. MFBS21]|uniref:hypothetical protein n=1 Tax=Runella sp. MFBS21 TaxID=3034018 RepID=UPI0023F9BDBA|nr:hypothetical protein [Runella sp. MFBS21]MDF7818393.1 hypothetical protein [Runella sp. MFBS21]